MWRYGGLAAPPRIAVPRPVLVVLRPGDFIFRQGTEPVSDAIRLLQRGGFSHVGMLVREDGRWHVIHAVPAEEPGRKDAVVDDDLDFFLAPARARRAAIYQVDATAGQRAVAASWAKAHIGEPFRLDSRGTYCTELLWQAYQAAGVDLEVRFTLLDLPLMRGRYLLPSGLRASPKLRRVWTER